MSSCTALLNYTAAQDRQNLTKNQFRFQKAIIQLLTVPNITSGNEAGAQDTVRQEQLSSLCHGSRIVPLKANLISCKKALQRELTIGRLGVRLSTKLKSFGRKTIAGQ